MPAKYIDTFGQIEWIADDGTTYIIPPNHDGQIQQEFEAWLAEGNSVSPYAAPDVEELPKMTFLKALRSTAQFAAAKAEYLTWDEDSDARLEWDFDTVIRKDGPVMAELKPALGLTDQQVTNFFNNNA